MVRTAVKPKRLNQPARLWRVYQTRQVVRNLRNWDWYGDTSREEVAATASETESTGFETADEGAEEVVDLLAEVMENLNDENSGLATSSVLATQGIEDTMVLSDNTTRTLEENQGDGNAAVPAGADVSSEPGPSGISIQIEDTTVINPSTLVVTQASEMVTPTSAILADISERDLHFSSTPFAPPVDAQINPRGVAFASQPRIIPADVSQQPSAIHLEENGGTAGLSELVGRDDRTSGEPIPRSQQRLENAETQDESMAQWREQQRQDEIRTLLARRSERSRMERPQNPVLVPAGTNIGTTSASTGVRRERLEGFDTCDEAIAEFDERLRRGDIDSMVERRVQRRMAGEPAGNETALTMGRLQH